MLKELKEDQDLDFGGLDMVHLVVMYQTVEEMMETRMAMTRKPKGMEEVIKVMAETEEILKAVTSNW